MGNTRIENARKTVRELEEKQEKLKQQDAIIQERKRRAKARIAAEKRKVDDGAKFVIGGFYLDWAERDPAYRKKLIKHMEQLPRERDKKRLQPILDELRQMDADPPKDGAPAPGSNGLRMAILRAIRAIAQRLRRNSGHVNLQEY